MYHILVCIEGGLKNDPHAITSDAVTGDAVI